jgi:hypothetical protein
VTRQTARLMTQLGPKHWPAGALLWKSRQQAAKKAKTADSRKANAALKRAKTGGRFV